MTELLTGLVGIGILIGLLYLGAQIRANTRALRAETFQALVGQSTRLLQTIYGNPEVAELLSDGRRGRKWEDLTPIQQARAHSALLAAYRTFDNMLYQHQVGTVDDELWAGNRAVILSYSATPLWREWFVRNRELFSERLQTLLSEGGWTE